MVRRAAIGDEGILRKLRLEALALDPHAFGSTYERELARTTADWQRWMSPGVVFILEDDLGPRGMVAGAHDTVDRAVVQLMAMWVHPDMRGSGGADALVTAVVAWAQSGRATTVRLQVVHDNLRARRFYERNGFTVTERTSIRTKDERSSCSWSAASPGITTIRRSRRRPAVYGWRAAGSSRGGRIRWSTGSPGGC